MRSVANPHVSDRDYCDCITAYVGKEKLNDMLGPHLAQQMHQVTPVMVVRSSQLVENLIRKGLTNGVIYPTRFEAALKMHCRTLPLEFNPDVYAHRATEHIRNVFALLREVKRDSQGPGTKRSKTSAFKRACSTSDNIIIKQVVDLLTDDNFTSSAPWSDMDPLHDIGRARLAPIEDLPKLQLPAATDLDALGYPKIFTDKSVFMTVLTGRSASSVQTLHSAVPTCSDVPGTCCSVASTTLYDSDGFPIIDDAKKLGCSAEKGMEQQRLAVPRYVVIDRKQDENDDSSDAIVLDPKPKRRKAAALGVAKKKPAAHKPVRAPKMKTKAAVIETTPFKKPYKAPVEVTPDKDDHKDVQILELTRPKLTGPTNETHPRCELTAFEVQADGSLKRVCIWTSRVSSWGESLRADMESIKNAILAGGMTKQSCVAMRGLFHT